MNNFCTNCAAEILGANNFCTKCGTAIIIQKSNNKKNQKIVENQKASPFWYLLPIFLGFVGGIIVFFILKSTDHQKAKRALVIGIILTIPLFAWISLQVVYGTQNPFYVVASGSMSPALEVYDVIIIQGHESFEDIEIGDIITFNRPSDHNRVIVQRVASILDDNPKTIRTLGDSNPASIPGTDFPITEEEYIGKVVYTLPQAGYVTQLLKPPINYVLVLAFYGIIFGILITKHLSYTKSKVKQYD